MTDQADPSTASTDRALDETPSEPSKRMLFVLYFLGGGVCWLLCVFLVVPLAVAISREGYNRLDAEVTVMMMVIFLPLEGLLGALMSALAVRLHHKHPGITLAWFFTVVIVGTLCVGLTFSHPW